MNTLRQRRPPFLDTSLVPWLLLGLVWLASVAQQSGPLALVAWEDGVEALLLPQAQQYVAELKHAAVPFTVLGFAGVFVLFPSASWVVCVTLLVSAVGVGIAFSSHSLPVPVFLVSSLLPALLYALALSIALRRRRHLSSNGV